MPHAIFTGLLSPSKLGNYMGVFNFHRDSQIVAPALMLRVEERMGA